MMMVLGGVCAIFLMCDFPFSYQDSTSGRVRVVDGELVIDEIVPSDGGLYSCMAVSTSGNASRDVAIQSKSSCPALYFRKKVS